MVSTVAALTEILSNLEVFGTISGLEVTTLGIRGSVTFDTAAKNGNGAFAWLVFVEEKNGAVVVEASKRWYLEESKGRETSYRPVAAERFLGWLGVAA